MTLILFNKPAGVLCQFSPSATYPTLANYLSIPNIYPAGRLDADSEGLLLLTDDGALQHKISHPTHKQTKTYLVQVEGTPSAQALEDLQKPLALSNFTTLGCKACHVNQPTWLWPRNPPIRQRDRQTTSWLTISIHEGKNRQVRKMTAAVGLPTLRLIRIAIGNINLTTHPLLPGEWLEISPKELT